MAASKKSRPQASHRKADVLRAIRSNLIRGVTAVAFIASPNVAIPMPSAMPNVSERVAGIQSQVRNAITNGAPATVQEVQLWQNWRRWSDWVDWNNWGQWDNGGQPWCKVNC